MGRVLSTDNRYVNLVRNPTKAQLCYGPSAGTSETGYLLRNNARLVLHNLTSVKCGYFVWFPDFHNNGVSGTTGVGNTFHFETNNSATAPTNTQANPFGSSSTAASADTDPSYSFIDSTAVSGARTIAASLKITYIGSTLNLAGQVATLTSVTPTMLLTGGAGGGPMSVADAFNSSPLIDRMPNGSREIVHLPTTHYSIYRDAVSNANTIEDTDTTNTCIKIPLISTGPSTIGVGSATAPGLLIAWDGLSTAQTSDICIELCKIVEWLPACNNNTGVPQSAARPASTLDTMTEALSNLGAGIRDSGFFDILPSPYDVGRYLPSAAGLMIGGAAVSQSLPRLRTLSYRM